MSKDEIPRKQHLDLMTPAERAIFDCAALVEALGPDARLTEAVILLGEARDAVAAFVDREPFASTYQRSQESNDRLKALVRAADDRAAARDAEIQEAQRRVASIEARIKAITAILDHPGRAPAVAVRCWAWCKLRPPHLGQPCSADGPERTQCRRNSWCIGADGHSGTCEAPPASQLHGIPLADYMFQSLQPPVSPVWPGDQADVVAAARWAELVKASGR